MSDKTHKELVEESIQNFKAELRSPYMEPGMGRLIPLLTRLINNDEYTGAIVDKWYEEVNDPTLRGEPVYQMHPDMVYHIIEWTIEYLRAHL